MRGQAVLHTMSGGQSEVSANRLDGFGRIMVLGRMA